MNWKYIIIIFFTCIAIFSLWFYRNHPLTSTITIANTKFEIELAITPEEKSKGLGYRNSLLPKHGMLFPYDHKERYDFGMMGMKFPLDFIWIAGGKIVRIDKNIPIPAPNTPDDKLKTYSAGDPIDYILEVNAGFSDQNKIKVGDSVDLTGI